MKILLVNQFEMNDEKLKKFVYKYVYTVDLL